MPSAEKNDARHKTANTKLIATPPEEDRVTARSNTDRKFGEIWTCGSGDMFANPQTRKSQ